MAGATIGYARNGLPDLSVSTTDATGFGFAVNVPVPAGVGAALVHAAAAVDRSGEKLTTSWVQVWVRPGTVTLVDLAPNRY